MKRLTRSVRVRQAVGVTLAGLLTFVKATNRVVLDPEDAIERYIHLDPFIGAMWHGQHFLMPFARPPDLPAKVMISRSADGEINAVAARRLGLGLIRASGGRTARQIAKRGGARGFREALATLAGGMTVAVTADVPKGPARQAGEGVVRLASLSSRPILPLAIVTSNRIRLERTWDRSTVNLPFGRMAIVYADPIWVPPDLSDAAVDHWREAVTSSLDRAHDRAEAIAREGARPVGAGSPNKVPARFRGSPLPDPAAGTDA